jgi:hypothetical protein
MKIEFEHADRIPSAHPDFSVLVVFKCEANVTALDVEILSVKSSVNTISGSTAWHELPVPSGLFGLFLRDKAIESYRNWKHRNF